ncbi:MAG: class I SAM-dependent methyltransferase [Treponema sp.]|jgi:ubiquinone/menaquinone biosynthesis C-methylase UbiE|nr:class I SAM-dependent methyltransferase [Treponema sp.]
MFKKFQQNYRRPQGIGGWLSVSWMNRVHTPGSEWGLENLAIKPGDHILDIGCGGGKNVKRMLKRADGSRVCGLDYSEVSVKKTMRLNRKAVREGRSEIRLGSVSKNPWPDNSFDVVTAFETVYFWPDFANDIREVWRVLKPGGLFFICNSLNRPEKGEAPYQFWIETLNLNVYSQSDYQNYLTGAGFSGVEFVCGENSALCVSARAAG